MFVRYLDIIVVLLAAPFVVLLGAPCSATSWAPPRGSSSASRRSRSSAAPSAQETSKTALGLNMASLVLRAWLIGLTILAVGLIADREDGLTAGITVLAAFTVYFATSLLIRPLERKSSRP